MGNQLQNDRLYGVDLQKVISMFMVIMLHILLEGGVIPAADPNSANYWIAWFMNIGVHCAVNCFALTSGYLMGYEGYKFKYRKIANLYVVVLFYTVLLMIVGLFFIDRFPKQEWYHIMPVTSLEFWYFTSYFCMFFFIPFINKLIGALSKKSYYILLLTGFVLFSLWSVIPPFNHDSFSLSIGYSPWWFIYLYFLGAGIKIYGLFTKMSCLKAFIGYICTVVFAWLIKFAVTMVINANIPYVSSAANIYGSDRLINYLSPVILASAIFMFVFCMKLKIPELFHKPLRVISPLVFQVMIIHMQFVVWILLFQGKFGGLASKSPVVMVLAVFGITVGTFVACLVIDWLRLQLFKRCRVNKIIDRCADKLVETYNGSKLKKKICQSFDIEE